MKGKTEQFEDTAWELLERDRQILDYQRQAQNQDLIVLLKENHIRNLSRMIDQKEIHIRNLNAELALIKNTLVWRCYTFIKKALKKCGAARMRDLIKGKGKSGSQGIQPPSAASAGTRREAGESEISPYCAGDTRLVELEWKTWARQNTLTPGKTKAMTANLDKLGSHPKISVILPVYNSNHQWLKKAIDSVCAQIYPNWELCIADDASPDEGVRGILEAVAANESRIKLALLDKNCGISGASNAAAAMAGGDYLAFLDHDDILLENALYEVVSLLNQRQMDVVYSDEELIDPSDGHISYVFKPDFSPDLLFSYNYITHFMVVKHSLFKKIDGFIAECDGAQDYDLTLKLAERTDKIHHIPKILYQWRMSPTSTSASSKLHYKTEKAGKRALELALERRKIPGGVSHGKGIYTYRVRRKILSEPLVSIIIPFKDQPQFLLRCVGALLDKTAYHRFEVIGISNNSEQPETFEAMKDLEKRDKRIRFTENNIPFNYSKLNNDAVAQAAGQHIVLMNNDIEVIDQGWLEALLEHSQRDEIGAVGAKLYYPGNDGVNLTHLGVEMELGEHPEIDTIQHAGVIVGIAGFAGHAHRHYLSLACGYNNRLMCIHNVSAVTGALMMVKKDLYTSLGGLEEKRLTVALNDVDFCLRIREKGYLNVFTPYCRAYHYESVSRGYEVTAEKKERFNKEVAYFQKKWQTLLGQGDPFYSPNLTLDREDFSIRT